MATQVGLTIGDYLGMFRRHVLLATAIIMVGSVASVLVASMVPGIYESSSIIQVVPQDISQNLVPSAFNDYAGQKIERIRQRVLTRDNILEIAQRYHLYGVDHNATATDVVAAFNRDVSIDLINSKDTARNWQTNPVIAFSVSFRGRNSWVVNKVDNDLATLFLNENARVGIARANEATRFLNQAANDLLAQLDDAGRKVAEFKAQNSASLPENKDVLLSAYQAAESNLREIGQEYQQTQDTISMLQSQLQMAQLAPAQSPGDSSVQDTSTDPVVELAVLKAQYAKLQAVYSDKHPTMQQLRVRIAALEKQVQATPTTSGSPTSAVSPLAGSISGRIRHEQANLAQLAQQRLQGEDRLQQLQRQLLAIPQIAQQLDQLQLGYDGLKKKYDDLRQKQASAQLDASLQEENKAEHFELVEQSMLADKPIKPNRIKLLLGGIGGSVLLAVGMIVLLESLGGRVRGVAALVAITGMMPLVVIPEIRSQDDIARRRRVFGFGFVSLAVGLVAALVAIQLLVMPLPTLVAKIKNYSTVPARGTYDNS